MTDLACVWIIPCDVPPEIAANCQSVLDDGERARADAFETPRDRQQFIIAHGALRTLASRELNTPAAALTWLPGQHGKPELAPPWSWLNTSLSHSASMIAVATSTGRPVGVDIQHLSPGLDVTGLSARFFPPDEAAYVAAGDGASTRADRFAHLWARKEAVVKTAGGRLWPNLAISVLDRAVVSCAEPAGTCRVADVTVPKGFRAAVSMMGEAPFAVAVAGWPTEVEVSTMA
ncbi:MAG TPA: 4'-phosphopantetheinyl transferase superfamily protein [Streptosporangiaceae bacterium]